MIINLVQELIFKELKDTFFIKKKVHFLLTVLHMKCAFHVLLKLFI